MRGEVGEMSKGVPEPDVGGVYWPCGMYCGDWSPVCRGEGAATGGSGGGRVVAIMEVCTAAIDGEYVERDWLVVDRAVVGLVDEGWLVGGGAGVS
jgi:hypothetical protein